MSAKWNKILATGYKEIDEEHKEMVAAANTVFQAIKGKNIDFITDKITNFVKSTKEHFVSEEAIMEKHNLSELEGHKKLHENLLKMGTEIIDLFEKDKSISNFKKNFKIYYNSMTKHIINYDNPVFLKVIKLEQAKVTN